MRPLNNRIDFVCPSSARGLAGNGGSEVFVNEELLGSVVKLCGGGVKGMGESEPLGKGMAAPPVAACCSRVVCGVETKDNGCPKLPIIMPSINGMI